MKRFASILTLAALLAHALGSAASDSLNPFDWSRLMVLGCVFIVTPLLMLAIGILKGAFE